MLECGRLPKAFLNPATEAEVTEQRLAKRVRWHHLRERAQEMLEKLKATRDTASGSSSPAAGFTSENEPLEAVHLTDKEKLIWNFLDEFKRKPQETNSAIIAERKLA